MTHPTKPVVWLVAVAVLFSACSGTERQTTGSTDQLTRVPARSDAEPLGLVARLYWPDDLTHERALDSITGPCMASHGFTLISLAPFMSANIDNSTADGTATAYRLSVDDARRFGYRSTGGTLPLSMEPPSYTDDYFAAYFGGGEGQRVDIKDARGKVLEVVQRGGCRGAAEQTLFGSLSDYFSLRPILENARNDSISRVMSSMPWQEDMDRWSSCMTSFGYDYANIHALRESLIYDVVGPTKVEVDVATADAKCRARNETDQLFIDLLWEAESDWIETNSMIFEAYTQMRQRATEKAKEILSQ